MATLVGTPVSTDAGFSVDRLAVALPAGVLANDVIFCVWPTVNNHTINSLSGFTQLGTTQDALTNSSTTVAIKTATGLEGATIDFTGLFTTAESGGTLCFAYRGLNTADLLAATVTQSTTTGTLAVGPSITPGVAGATVLQIIGADPSGAIGFTPDALGTTVFSGSVDSGSWGWAAVQSYEQVAPAAIALDGTMTVSNDYAHFQIALKPAAAGDTVDTIDNPVLDAETGNAATYTGFATASINAVTVDGITGSSVVDDDAGNVTWTNPSIMAIALGGGGPIPDFGTVAVEFTNGTETGSANTTFSEATGFSTVTLAAIDTVSADYLYQLLLGVGITIANGEEIYYNNQSGQFTITADGGIVSNVSTSVFTNIKAGPIVTDQLTWTNGTVAISGLTRNINVAMSRNLSRSINH